MKKKLINGLLMAALFVGFTSSMVSCKDYDDEKIDNFERILASNDATLRQLLAAQKAELEGKITDLETALNACKSTCAAFQTEITSKLNDYLLITTWNTYKAEIDGKLQNIYTKAEIDSKLDGYYTKAEIDALLAGLDYYTQDEVDAKLRDLENLINQKASIESIIELLNSGNNALVEALNNYFINNSVIEDYVKGITISKEDVEQLINEAMAGVTPGLDRDAVQALIDQAMAGINPGLDQAAVQALIDQALAGINTGLDSDAVKLLIAEYIEGMSFGLDSDAVKALIAEALIEVNNSISEAAATASQALELANSNKTAIENLNLSVDNLNLSVENLNLSIENLNTIVEGLTNSIIDLGTQVTAAQAAADEAKAAAEANRALIINLQSNYNELAATVEGLQGDVNSVKILIDEQNEKIDALAESVAEEFAKADELHRQILETISGLVGSIEDVNVTIGSVKDQLQKQINIISDNLEAISVAVEENAAKIEENATKIEKLLGIFENTMAKFISGIELNGSYNPLFGYFNTPFDVRSNVLVAFHGTSGDGIKFPTDDADYYALPAAEQWNRITEKDIEMLGGDLTKVKGYLRMGANMDIIADDGKEGNAGILYLTVNPTDRDFTGTEFTLINSQNVESPFIISDLQKSSKVLRYIYSRGGGVSEQSPNGFYEAKATLKLADIDNVRVQGDIAGLKSVKANIENYVNGTESFDMMEFAQVLYSNVNDLLDANAIKATWTDDFGQKSVISQYGIAATSLKPLSYAFLKELDDFKDKIKTRVEDYLDQLLSKIHLALPEWNEIYFPISSIDVPDYEGETITWTIHTNYNFNSSYSGPMSATFRIPSIKYIDENGVAHEIFDSGYHEFKVDVDVNNGNIKVVLDLETAIKELFGDVDPVEKVEDYLAQINDFVDDLNDYINSLNDVEVTFKGDVRTLVSDYLTLLSKKLTRVTPNKFLQPVMLIKTSDGYVRLSETVSYPSNLYGGAQVTLVPTSFNAEMLSAAYKKFVAITNVTKGDESAQAGNAECKSVLDKANAQDNIAEVIDGSMKYLDIELTPGYTYEILYTCVDYSGYVVTKKCYLGL